MMIIFAVLVVFSCRKNAPDSILPPISSNGSHTLGFFLNNNVWVPYDRGMHEQHELPQPVLEHDGHLKITSTRIDEDNNARNWFCLEIENCKGPGKYHISNPSCKSAYQTFYYGNNKDKDDENYIIDTLQPHLMEIQYLDTNKQIISGIFSFDAVSQNNQDTIKVRSGRFDLKYRK